MGFPWKNWKRGEVARRNKVIKVEKRAAATNTKERKL